jgi:hypothetical protein
VVAEAHPLTAGKIEQHGFGIYSVSFLPKAVIHFVIELLPSPPQRMPEPHELSVRFFDIEIPKIAFQQHHVPVEWVLDFVSNSFVHAA